jgi:hypothetical protein
MCLIQRAQDQGGRGTCSFGQALFRSLVRVERHHYRQELKSVCVNGSKGSMTSAKIAEVYISKEERCKWARLPSA